MQRKHLGFLRRLSTILMLGIFSLVIMPWKALHHHHDTAHIVEKNCTHKIHVKTSSENCLVCKAHVEKNYTVDFYTYLIHLKGEFFKRIFPALGELYTSLIASSLRGPPSFF